MTSLGPNDRSFQELFAVTEQIVDSALAEVLPEEADGPRAVFDLFVLLDRSAHISEAHRAFEVLAVQLSDRFGAASVSRPTAYMSEVMLHAQVAGPDTEGFVEALRTALRSAMRRILGPDADEVIAVEDGRRRGRRRGPSSRVPS